MNTLGETPPHVDLKEANFVYLQTAFSSHVSVFCLFGTRVYRDVSAVLPQRERGQSLYFEGTDNVVFASYFLALACGKCVLRYLT